MTSSPRIPQLRKGVDLPHDPRAPPPHRPRLYAVVIEAWVHGVSTRSVDDLVVALGGHRDLRVGGVPDLPGSR